MSVIERLLDYFKEINRFLPAPLAVVITEYANLLPKDADYSARVLRSGLERLSGKRIGVLIIDSHGRAWSNGIVGTSIGLAGIPALVDMRGKPDRFNYSLRVTLIAAADELAAGASLMMGKAAEGTPVILARGFPYELAEDRAFRLVREKQLDLFRL